jgi:hypothetical protein
MQIDALTRTYRAKTDEELVQLASESDQLTPEGNTALASELTRRNLVVPHGWKNDSGRSPEPTLDGPDSSLLARPADFVAAVLRLCKKHFWLFFQFTLPATMVSALFTLLARDQVRDITRYLPRGAGLAQHQWEILQMGLLTYSSFALSWIVFSFSFAAISVVVLEIAKKSEPTIARTMRSVSERKGVILGLSIVLFLGFILVEAAVFAVNLVVIYALHRMNHKPSPFAVQMMSIVAYAIGALILSRLAISVPVVVSEDCSVRQSLFRSDELTQGKWIELASLLFKSIVGGYIAAYLPFWLSGFFLARLSLPSWFSWLLFAFSIVGVSSVDIPMFVGFAALYAKPAIADSKRQECDYLPGTT